MTMEILNAAAAVLTIYGIWPLKDLLKHIFRGNYA